MYINVVHRIKQISYKNKANNLIVKGIPEFSERSTLGKQLTLNTPTRQSVYTYTRSGLRKCFKMCIYTPDCCAIFYPIWCICFGAVGMLLGILMATSHSPHSDVVSFAFSIGFAVLVIALTYVIAGILMMLGDRLASSKFTLYG